jgi:hypothetical protein
MTYQVRDPPTKGKDGPSSEHNGQARSNDLPDMAFNSRLCNKRATIKLML